MTYNVHPDLWVLSAVEELVSGSRLDKIGEAVSMLEYLHSHYPDLPEEREYVNLIVDMKTKVHVQNFVGNVVITYFCMVVIIIL